jgi:SAM-dependent methyltransferase
MSPFSAEQMLVLSTQGFSNPEPGHHFSDFEDTTAVPELVSSAYGKILELGPATGNQLPRFNASKIIQIYGVEPNPIFTTPLRAKIAEMKLESKYTFITGSVDDETMLANHGIEENSLDCVLSIQVLCSVDDPKKTASLLWRLLKPGGTLIFWEHHRSHDWVSRVIQGINSLPFLLREKNVADMKLQLCGIQYGRQRLVVVSLMHRF